MILQPSPNAWSCLPTAFAMAVGWPVTDLIRLLGHDGGYKQWPMCAEPLCYRGFHVQELIALVWRLGCATTPVEAIPCMKPTLSYVPVYHYENRFFDDVVKTTRGVLTGKTRIGHAVAYDHGFICDPRGRTYRISDDTDFSAETAWVLTPLKY